MLKLPYRTIAAAALSALALPQISAAQPAGRTVTPPRADLADMAAGLYSGDVISDARGASRSDVAITVTKIGPNKVQVTANYPRLPAFTASLTRAMDTIQNASGNEVFLLDLSKQPRTLHVTVDDASWAGTKD